MPQTQWRMVACLAVLRRGKSRSWPSFGSLGSQRKGVGSRLRAQCRPVLRAMYVLRDEVAKTASCLPVKVVGKRRRLLTERNARASATAQDREGSRNDSRSCQGSWEGREGCQDGLQSHSLCSDSPRTVVSGSATP